MIDLAGPSCETSQKYISDIRLAADKEMRIKTKEDVAVKTSLKSHKRMQKRSVGGLKKGLQEILHGTGLGKQLDLLAAIVMRFTKCRVIVGSSTLTTRKGKSWFYVIMKRVQSFLKSSQHSGVLIRDWAAKLIVQDYRKFKNRGLRFMNTEDIPLEVRISERALTIREQVFGNKCRNDVRNLYLEVAIRVYKVRI